METKVYIVIRSYKALGASGTDFIGAYTSHDLAMKTVYEEIDDNYKKYGKHPRTDTRSFTIKFYEDYVSSVPVNYKGSIAYTIVETKREAEGIVHKDAQYIYEIQEHIMNQKAPEGVGVE